MDGRQWKRKQTTNGMACSRRQPSSPDIIFRPQLFTRAPPMLTCTFCELDCSVAIFFDACKRPQHWRTISHTITSSAFLAETFCRDWFAFSLRTCIKTPLQRVGSLATSVPARLVALSCQCRCARRPWTHFHFMIARVFAYSFLSSEVFVCTNESDIPGQVRVEVRNRCAGLASWLFVSMPTCPAAVISPHLCAIWLSCWVFVVHKYLANGTESMKILI